MEYYDRYDHRYRCTRDWQLPRPEGDETKGESKEDYEKYRGVRNFRWGRCYATPDGKYIKMTKTNDLFAGFH